MKSSVFLASLLVVLLEQTVQEVAQNDVQQTDDTLCRTESVQKELKELTVALREKLEALESRMVEVERVLEHRASPPRVAFSVGLTDSGKVGPSNGVTTLVFRKIFSNLGQAYSPVSGIFTAPARGVYFFTFTGFNNQAHPGAMVLYHNHRRLRHPWTPSSQHSYFSNAVTVQMEEGDVVYVQLPAGHSLYDNPNHHCTLTGTLLFTL